MTDRAHEWYISDMLGDYEVCRRCGILRSSRSLICGGKQSDPFNEVSRAAERVRSLSKALRAAERIPPSVPVIDEGKLRALLEREADACAQLAQQQQLQTTGRSNPHPHPTTITIARAICNNTDGCPLDIAGCSLCDIARVNWLIETAERVRANTTECRP